ncbi:MAG: 2-oxoglutarate dehydrogenase E1 component [Planctomycetota bacterium]
MSQAPSPVLPSVNGWNADYLDAQHRRYLDDPDSVPPDLRLFFQGFDLAAASAPPAGLTPSSASPRTAAAPPTAPQVETFGGPDGSVQAAVDHLINAYRRLGHMCAQIDPFGRERETPTALLPEYFGFTDAHLDQPFHLGTLGKHHGQTALPLRRIIEILDTTYCSTIGVEIDHITNITERLWLKDRIETVHCNRPTFGPERKRRIHEQLTRAEGWETFCHKRYPGVKRFSLEGGETLVPMLLRALDSAADDYAVAEIVLGMSHRGRLNVLTNVVGKPYAKVFTEFEDLWDEVEQDGGTGDVKYHRGYSANHVSERGKDIWIALASNPSHLESVGPVALGRCRAKQRLRGDQTRDKVIPILLHGDAAVIGQGVVAETFNISQLDGYTVGGTVHIVVNNLVGFTTGPDDGRSSRYCTDFAKQIEAPVFHVNGEDPEAAVHVMQLALDYRMRFHKDVVVDVVCYRKHGHNESDEAAFTQPKLYAEIKRKPSVLKVYAEALAREGVVTADDAKAVHDQINTELDSALSKAREAPEDPTPDPGHRRWVGLTNEWDFTPVRTAVTREDLLEISRAFAEWPDHFTPHPKVAKLSKARANAIAEDKDLDWALAEQLAIGSLLIEGTIVRMSGQDSCRGTFSQRHAVLVDHQTAERHTPLNFIREQGVAGTEKEVGSVNEEGKIRQAKYCIYDSPLSEFAVLGFEYGFSLASPNMLTLWEAQFGDFANGAQVIFDQFIASAEAKWFRWSSLTVLLPHGYEGQGPEHSSARIERFLKLCGANNMQVAVPTTPAQYFHILRRQVLRRFRKPLILFTPKSLLRLPACVSTPAELIDGHFHEVLDDPAFVGAKPKQREAVNRLILCTGKVYYDLLRRREESGRDDVAIARVEQLYPLKLDALREVITSYPKAELVWVQEEPQNAGAWGHMCLSFRQKLDLDLPYIGRATSPSPAVGSPRKHREELDAFLTEAIGPVTEAEPTAKPARAKQSKATTKKTTRKSKQQAA